MRIVVCERKSGSGPFVLIVRLNRIFETAGLTHNRKCSVAERHQLGESARLKQRRHEESIRGCINLVRQFIGITNLSRNLIAVFPRKIPEHVLVPLFSGTENDDLHCILAELIHHIGDEIKALLIRQPRDNADHHAFFILLEPELLLQRGLVLYLLLAEIDRIVRRRNILVDIRTEDIIVDAVEYAAKIPRAGTEQAIQTLPVESA